MSSSEFTIDILNLYWINGKSEDSDDLCLHGDVSVKIGQKVIADSYSCTVSSTALYLLKTLRLDHILGQENQMLPCCGHFIIPSETEDTVEISGCPNGIDWSVLHIDGCVKIVTEDGKETIVSLSDYADTVFSFVDRIEEFYKNCKTKSIPTDIFEREGYEKFWKEWKNRRCCGIA